MKAVVAPYLTLMTEEAPRGMTHERRRVACCILDSGDAFLAPDVSKSGEHFAYDVRIGFCPRELLESRHGCPTLELAQDTDRHTLGSA